MKLVKTVKKLFKKILKLVIKGGKAYYKAKLKGLVTTEGVKGLPVSELVQIADDIQGLLKTVRNYHELPEQQNMLLSVSDDEVADLEFKDKNGISWEYEVSRSDGEPITHEDIDSLKGDC